MGYAEITFVLALLLSGLWAVLLVRRDFLDRDLSRRDEQRQAELEERRRRALSRGYRPTSRR